LSHSSCVSVMEMLRLGIILPLFVVNYVSQMYLNFSHLMQK